MSKQGNWVTVDTREFLARKGRVDRGHHSPKAIKRIPWPVCSRCGLLYLKNEATRKAINAACSIEVDA